MSGEPQRADASSVVSGEHQRADVSPVAVGVVSGEHQRADVFTPGAASHQASRCVQRFHWRAVSIHGHVVEERDAHDRVHAFDAVRREDVARLALVETAAGAEVVALDAATGVFHALGRRLEFVLDGELLTGREGVSYRDVTQFKSAHATWSPARGASGTIVDAHHVGYRAQLPEGRLEVAVGVRAADSQVVVEAVFVPGVSAPTGSPRRSVSVLVDGRPWPDTGRPACPR